MKSKVLGLLAVGLLVGPMSASAVPLTVGPGQWDITSCVGTWPVCNAVAYVGTQPWFTNSGDSSLAEQFARAWAAAYPAQDSPLFAWTFTGSDLGGVDAWYYSAAGAGTVASDFFFDGSAPNPFNITAQTFAVASRVPEPGSLALLGLGLAGLGLSRRRKAA